MIYALIESLHDWLVAHHLAGYANVFRYAEFRAVCSLILSFFFVLAAGPRTIRWLMRMKIGDNPEFHHQSLNELTKGKKNTPTMGGILIVGSILFSTLLLADIRHSYYIHMALICLVWLAAVGMWDDYLKLTSARRKPGSRDGLHSWEKMVFQVGLAVLLGLFIHHHGVSKFSADNDPHHYQQMSHVLNLPFLKTWTWDAGARDFVPNLPGLIVLGPVAFVLLTTLVISGSSNAVNLTDGMDGLASGIMTVVAFAFMILVLIAGYEHKGVGGTGEEARSFILAKYLLVPYIPYANELAIVAAAMVGACLGFLWFNCSPAQVFMGDTGSLPLGGLIGFIAVVIRQEFLLLIIGGVFVMEAVSVMMQVGYFKISKGKRIFRCAPIHHHFHLGGWTEQQVVVRFWVVSIILAALALATIRVR